MGRPVVVGVEPLEAAMSRMSFFATDLANNAWLKITAMAAVGAVVSGVVDVHVRELYALRAGERNPIPGCVLDGPT